jgi:biopolymer transport protein ExbD
MGVAVTRQGQILLNGVLASPEMITARVREALEKDPDTQALISADGDARHADVVRAIDLIKSAGMSRFAIQIEKQ